MDQSIDVAPHPLLDWQAIVTTFDRPLGEIDTPDHLLALLDVDHESPFSASDDDRKVIRDLLRRGGFKPTGRSKPASEYLIKASRDGKLGHINLAVDVCNVVSLHSGLPISVVDLDLVTPPLRIDTADPGASYVFNRSGQTIDIGGLICLFDAEGPCANAVKDSQRTKTTAETRRTLSIIWGTKTLPDRSEGVAQWYRELLAIPGVYGTLKS